MSKYIPFFGWAGILCGAGTAVMSFLPGWGGLMAMALMLPGFLFSSLYVMLTLRAQPEDPKLLPGYIGLLLNSVPVLLIIYFMIFR